MSEFLEWYQSLAPENETALIVLQKPILNDGELQYHGDGAIRCTWPAMLPSKWKEGKAFYGNTGSFILDRFKDGKPSASRDNIEYCIVMVLDDIGSKSKEPPLAPTWIMETSPGNYQWGYAFSEQPTKGEFTAAIVAIAEAGYTDKGALNPVRNWRLPGSVNLKPDKSRFVSHLVEFHPDREFTLGGICAALGVTPIETDTAKLGAIRIEDDGKDDVLAWMNTQGLIIEKANSSGWYGCTCPNHEMHSDGNPMGRYHPTTRAYMCFHESCTGWNSESFLEWVEHSGGPSHQSGLRDDLLAEAMTKVYEKIGPGGDRFSIHTEAKSIIAEVNRKQLNRISLNELHGRFVYVAVDNGFFDMNTRREYARATFDAVYRHIDTRSRHGKNPRVTASVWFDETRKDNNGLVLEGITYAPGETELITDHTGVYGNKWVDARITPTPGDVTPWLEHCKKMVPTEFEREHILNVMAFKLQNPQTKINHALLIAGRPGVGKDTMMAPFFHALCGPFQRNFALVDTKALESQWGYAYETELVVINELRPDQSKDRRALENNLKPIIAAPPEYLEVNRKGLHPYKALNRLLVIAFSNFKDAIALPSEDRRWFVAWCEGAVMPDSEAKALWTWYKHDGGFAAIAAWLSARDVSMFNPGAKPPLTDAKLTMIESARSGGEEFLIEKIAGRLGEFSRGVIGPPYNRLLDMLQGEAGNTRLHKTMLEHALQEAGWVDLGMQYTRRHSTKKRVWCDPAMLVEHSRAALRDMLESQDTAKVPLAVVK